MTVSRRQFLAGSAAVVAGQMTTGCTFFQRSSLKVQILDGTLPVQLLKLFRRQMKAQGGGGKFKFVPVPSTNEVFTILQYWRAGQDAYQRGRIKLPFRGGKNPVDLITLGDAWLTGAIRKQLIQPLDPSQWSEWEGLPEQWQSLVRRNDEGLMDPQGKIWAAPYRGGSTAIAYRKNRLRDLDLKIEDWDDLWNEKLKGHISLLDDPREVIGLTLKSLGTSYNTTEPRSVAGLEEKLGALHAQTKLYASNYYLQPLLLEDTWVAVGWSGDLLPLLQRDRNLALVYPKSGTSLWADLWVQPRGNVAEQPPSLNPVSNDWINFCWESDVAKLISTFSNGSSPRSLDVTAQGTTGRGPTDWELSPEKQAIVLPEEERLLNSEFIQPLPQKNLDAYQSLWQEMKKGELSP